MWTLWIKRLLLVGAVSLLTACVGSRPSPSIPVNAIMQAHHQNLEVHPAKMYFASPKSKTQTALVTGDHPFMEYNGCGYGIANIQPHPRGHTKKGTPYTVAPQAPGKCEVLFSDYSSAFVDFYVTVGK